MVYQFEWPSVTFFKVTIIERQITRKWYNTELYLQWPTNRKSYIIYPTAPFSMTLNDPYPQFQGHAILWCRISQKRYKIQTYLQWNINMDWRPTQHCHFEWPWVSLSDLAEYSMIPSVARSICDSCERMSNFWTVWFLETEYEQNFGFPYIPTDHPVCPC